MVQLSPQRNNLIESNFGKRTLSAAIGGPLAIGMIILGSPYVDIFAALLLGILLWEWSKMSGLPLLHPISAVVWGLLAWFIFAPGAYLSAISFVVIGLLFTAFYHYQVGARLVPSLILLSGPIYIGLGMTMILFFSKTVPLILLWSLMMVWATDTGAYVVGSLLGGPKLIPRISPNKTWSGFIGGSMFGSAVGMTLAPYCQVPLENQVHLFCLSLLITFVAHIGDILESLAKRIFKIKDSGHIIPGHGGLLDRIDSLLLVALFLGVLKFANIF
ncbi:MAG: hypothetical protein FJX71_02265 [Alphaproteobacteria bacterium]|nr:hypothetical protein [Alphaproteobacteria bacterium]